MKTKTLFALIACNLIWSAHPAVAKVALADVRPVTLAWLRYGSALFAYALGLVFLRARLSQGFMPPRPMALLLGLLAFCLGPILHMTGLNASRAVDNSLIIAMEPMMTVFLAWILLKERPTRAELLSFALALFGFSLLSELSLQKISGGWDVHLLGNLVLLLSLVGEASYSPLGRMLMKSHSPLQVFGTGMLSGVFFLSLASALLGQIPTPDDLAGLTWQSVIGILWLGPLGTTATYLYWMVALTQAPIATIVITLFVQPIFGTVWGHLFLGERLSSIQALGAVLILLAVFASSGRHLTQHKKAEN